MSESNTQAPTYEKRRRSKAPLITAIAVVVALGIAAATYLFLNRDGSTSQASNEIKVGLVLEPTSLDVRTDGGVATGQILIDNVYQGLLGIAPGTVADLVPVLATEMPQVSEDGLVYTFTVRDDVTFHNGDALTINDVKTSLETTLVEGAIGFDAVVDQVGDWSITITLQQPNSMLLWYLANTPGLILQDGATNQLQNSAIGTGPFVFTNWKQGDSITLDKNPNYWGTEALVDRAIFRFFPEGRAAVNALKDGDVDVHTALLSPLRAEFDGNADFVMQRADSSDVFTLAYNNARAPFDDPRVRQALSMAIDAEALVSAQHGDARTLGGPITRLEPGYSDLTSVNEFNPEAARALLAEAGQPALNLTITAPNFYDTTSLDLVKSQLAEIGVVVKVNRVEFATWFSEVYVNHDFDLSYIDHAEARDFENYTKPGYYFGYDNPEVQALYAEATKSIDPAKQQELLEQAARLVAEDAPVKWLFNYTPTNVVSTNVSGFPEVNTNSRVNLAGVSVS